MSAKIKLIKKHLSSFIDSPMCWWDLWHKSV